MVYFNCSQCGTGLRKNQVETHMRSCRSRVYSCIDCQKDFKNDEYKSHVKCMTESERYESKNYVAKQNKGDVKQNAWFEKVLKAVETFRGSPKAKSLLEKLTDYPNVPRKKAKFFNFVRNSFRSYNVTDSQLDEIWSVIESFDKADKPQNGNQTNGNHLKRKLDENENDQNGQTENKKSKESDQNDEKENNPFDWQESIKKELSKKDDKMLSIEKLENKILKKYKKSKSIENDSSEDNSSVDVEKFKKKFNKKLKKMTDLISLIEHDSKTHVKLIDDQSE